MTTPTPFSPNASEKPGMVSAIAIMILVNGILNILWGLGTTSGIVLGTLGIGLLCAPVTLLPGILGIFEIIYAAKLISSPAQPVLPNQTISILEICCILAGNVLSAVVGILVLVFYNDPIVKTYFARINGLPLPTVQVIPPVQPPQPSLPVEPAQPVLTAEPVKPKRPARPKAPKSDRSAS